MKFDKVLLGFLCFMGIAVLASAQPATVVPVTDSSQSFAQTILPGDLKAHLSILASDEFEGRETGTIGNKRAAQYIASQFQQFGFPGVGNDNSYFQPVAFAWTMWDRNELEVKGQKYRHLWDYISFPDLSGDMGELKTNKVLFLGYGIEDEKYSDYKGVDAEGAVILIYKGEPVNEKGVSFISGTTQRSAWSDDLEKKLAVAKKNGVACVLVIEDELQKKLADNRRLLLNPMFSLGKPSEKGKLLSNHYLISTNIAKEIMGKRLKKVVNARNKINESGTSTSVKLKAPVSMFQQLDIKTLEGENVLGYLEGSHPEKKNELVVVTAHYDHLGKRGNSIYNGADDNGSGTSTVIEVAQAFAEAKKAGKGPDRSVLFMLVTGEEKGLLGSKYYVEYPLFPLEQTVANVNVDMVGRVDEKYAANPNYVYVIGSDRLSTELHAINESVNKEYTQLTLDYTYNAEDDPNRYYYRSDHYNFAERGIPAIFYFNGTHADYHRVSDTVEKINFNKMAKIGQLIFHTTWELANREKRIVVDVPQK